MRTVPMEGGVLTMFEGAVNFISFKLGNHYFELVTGNKQSGRDNSLYLWLRRMAWMQGLLIGLTLAFSSFWLIHKLGGLFLYGNILPQKVANWGYFSGFVMLWLTYYSSKGSIRLIFACPVLLGNRRLYVIMGLFHILAGLLFSWWGWESDFSIFETGVVSLSVIGLGLLLWIQPSGLFIRYESQQNPIVLIMNSVRYYIKSWALIILLFIPLYVLGATAVLVEEINHSSGSLMSVLSSALYAWSLPVVLFVILCLYSFFERVVIIRELKKS